MLNNNQEFTVTIKRNGEEHSYTHIFTSQAMSMIWGHEQARRIWGNCIDYSVATTFQNEWTFEHNNDLVAVM